MGLRHVAVKQVDAFTSIDGLDEGDEAVSMEEGDGLKCDEGLCCEHCCQKPFVGIMDWSREPGRAGGVHHYQFLKILFLEADTPPGEWWCGIIGEVTLLSRQDWDESE